jgi:hypothetical protein
MDAKARDLTLLAALSLFCAMVTWAGDRDILGSAFFALGLVAICRSSATPAMMAPFAKGLAARVAAIEKPRKSCGAKSRGTNALGGLPRTA